MDKQWKMVEQLLSHGYSVQFLPGKDWKKGHLKEMVEDSQRDFIGFPVYVEVFGEGLPSGFSFGITPEAALTHAYEGVKKLALRALEAKGWEISEQA